MVAYFLLTRIWNNNQKYKIFVDIASFKNKYNGLFPSIAKDVMNEPWVTRTYNLERRQAQHKVIEDVERSLFSYFSDFAANGHGMCSVNWQLDS